MNTVSKVVLGLSVFANVGLAAVLWSWRESATPISTASLSDPAAAAEARGPGAPQTSALSPAPRKPGEPDPQLLDPRAIAERMRKDGFGDEAIFAAVEYTIRNGLISRPPDTRTRWRQVETISPRPTIDAGVTRVVARAEASRILGYVGMEDRLAYGDLGWEKIAAIGQVELEWANSGPKAQAVFARGQATVDGRATAITAAAREEVQRELLSALGAVLSPDELTNYLQTKGAGGMNGVTQLQNQLAGLSIDDATYRSLADATLISQFRNPTSGTPAQRYAHQTGLYRQYRELLGDEKFARTAAKLDRTGTILGPVLQAASVPPEVQAELFLKVRDAVGAVQYGDPAARPAIAALAIDQVSSAAGLAPEQKAALGTALFPPTR